ncbi:MAG TPA: fumarylacetoacetate hydrolase family protein [Usitatibacter sp.]|nr:fumarylacetoacetate hydrolase family protein [Usitatibacter sp.]
MKKARREFLRQAGIGSAALGVTGCAVVTGGSGGMGGEHGGMHAEHMNDPEHARIHAEHMAQMNLKRQGAGPMPRGMTFVTFERNGRYTLGVKTERGILDVAAAAARFGATCPTTIDDAIRYGDAGLSQVVAKAGGESALWLSEAGLRFGPAVTNPPKIVCVGLNYARHARETNNPIPKLPILFNKFNNALNCHQGTVHVSRVPAKGFDYESELVVVMGKRAHDVSEADALSYVFGYCSGNDFTARDLQSASSQWMIGKTCDGFGVLGPYVVTADQCDPNNMKVVGTVNGEVRQSSNTSDMVFNCAQIIAYTSKLMTLEPGDLIYTGTPEGVIAGYPRDRQVWLKPGDKLTTTIGNLGTLAFTLA